MDYLSGSIVLETRGYIGKNSTPILTGDKVKVYKWEATLIS